ncbi:MAG: hypothetical protein CMD88_01545 [Gammaproteobacteria bacterium]|nr:hypothetical protein [Gammaproteobacteria bacterium]|tara:strand:+ start:757 stop:1473 length:717 start_codon:yes stop_codon:yes gene_type:complete
MFDNVYIVLIETSHPGNIGSTARAMKTMGLKRLVLVNPKKFPSEEANSLAVGCKDILKKTKVSNNLNKATEKTHINIGFSARSRKAKIPNLTIDECVNLINENPNLKFSVLFGNEKSGLSNTELLICDYLVNIPTHKDYKSLNLSAAVQIFVYDLYKKYISSKYIDKATLQLATSKEKQYFLNKLIELMKNTKYITNKNVKSLTKKIHIIFNKAKLEKNEVNLLMGLINSLVKTNKNS